MRRESVTAEPRPGALRHAPGMRRVRRVCAGCAGYAPGYAPDRYARYAPGTPHMRRVRRICARHAGYAPCAGYAPGTPCMCRVRRVCADYCMCAPGTPDMCRVCRAQAPSAKELLLRGFLTVPWSPIAPRICAQAPIIRLQDD